MIFHVVGSFLGDVAAVVALDHAEREIDARGKSAGAGEIPVFDEPGAALEMDIRELHRKRIKCGVKCGGGFAGQQPGLGQNKGAGANRHRDVGVLGRFTNPFQHRCARFTLGRDDDDLRRGRVYESIVGDNFHPAARSNRISFVRNRVKAEWVIAAGNHDISEDFPRPAKVDDHCAF